MEPRTEHLENTGLFGRVMADISAKAQEFRASGQPIPATSGDECATCKGARVLAKRTPRRTQDGGNHHLVFETMPCPTCVNLVKDLKTFAEWKHVTAMKPALDACYELLRGERWCVFLRGSYGVGKSHLAMATCVDRIQQGGSALFIRVSNVLELLRTTQRDGAKRTLDEVIHKFETVDLLALDDMGVDRATEFAREQLFRIVDTRYRYRRPLIVTSNVRHSEEREQIGDRILSRLGNGEVVIADTTDRRRTHELP